MLYIAGIKNMWIKVLINRVVVTIGLDLTGGTNVQIPLDLLVNCKDIYYFHCVKFTSCWCLCALFVWV